jgi:ribosomal protein S3
LFNFYHLFNRLIICVGEKGRRIRELTSVVQKRFKFPENSVELYAEKVNNRGLCAIAQAESLRYKLLGGLAVRRYKCLNRLYILLHYDCNVDGR